MERKMCGCALRPKSKEERNDRLRRDAARIVAGVENYSEADRVRRGAEVRAAFPPVTGTTAKVSTAPVAKKSASVPKKPAAAKTVAKAAVKKSASAKTAVKSVSKPAMKSTAKAAGIKAKTTAKKGPATAGMSVGPHDGDAC